MIITCDDVGGIFNLKLTNQFKKKDWSTLLYFLRIEVSYSLRGYLLSQSKYISNTLEQAYFYDTQTKNSPLKLNVKFFPSDGVPLPGPTPYHT